MGSGLDNYLIGYQPGNLAVHPAELLVSANNQSRIYGVTNPVLTVSFSGFVNGESLATSDVGGTAWVVTTAETNSPVGGYDLVATSGTLTSTNYSFAFSNGVLTVAQAAITVTANPAIRSYGETNPVFTASYRGFVSGEGTNVVSGAPALITVADTNSPTGSYLIVAGLGTLSATNYAFHFVNGTLTVLPMPLLVTANADRKTYDGVAYTGGNGVTYLGLVNGEDSSVLGGTLIYDGTAQGAKNAGDFLITPSGLTSTNYLINYLSGTLTIHPLTVYVTANATNKTYGAVDPLLSYEYSPALVAGDSFSGALTRVAGETVGDYAIGQGTLALSANYILNYSGANLAVDPAVLTITANNDSKVYGQTRAYGSGSTAFAALGLQNGETVGSVTITAIGGTAANASVGSYQLLASAATGGTFTASNYQITYLPGSLTVSAAPAPLGQAIRISDGQLTVSFTGVEGVTYVTQSTTNLLGPWSNISTNTPGADGAWSVSDWANTPGTFYRAVIP